MNELVYKMDAPSDADYATGGEATSNMRVVALQAKKMFEQELFKKAALTDGQLQSLKNTYLGHGTHVGVLEYLKGIPSGSERPQTPPIAKKFQDLSLWIKKSITRRILHYKLIYLHNLSLITKLKSGTADAARKAMVYGKQQTTKTIKEFIEFVSSESLKAYKEAVGDAYKKEAGARPLPDGVGSYYDLYVGERLADKPLGQVESPPQETDQKYNVNLQDSVWSHAILYSKNAALEELNLWNGTCSLKDRWLQYFQEQDSQNYILKYSIPLDHQYISSMVYYSCVGPYKKMADLNQSELDRRCLFLAPTGTGKSMTYYQILYNLLRNDVTSVEQNVYVFVRDSTYYQQLMGLLKFAGFLNEMSDDDVTALKEFDSIDAVDSFLERKRTAASMSPYTGVYSRSAGLDESDPKTHFKHYSTAEKMNKERALKNVNFISWSDVALMTNDLLTTSERTVKDRIYGPGTVSPLLDEIKSSQNKVFIFDEIDEVLENGVEYTSKIGDDEDARITLVTDIEKFRQEGNALSNKFMNAKKALITFVSDSGKRGGFRDVTKAGSLFTVDKIKAEVERVKANLPVISDSDEKAIDRHSALYTGFWSNLQSVGSMAYRNFFTPRTERERLPNYPPSAIALYKFLHQAEFDGQYNYKDPTVEDEVFKNPARNDPIEMQLTHLQHDMTAYITQIYAELMVKLEERSRRENLRMGFTWSEINKIIENSSQPCKGVVGLTATLGSKDTCTSLFHLFRRNQVTDLDDVIDKIIPSISSNPIMTCGLQNVPYGYYDFPQGRLDDKLFEQVCEQVNITAISKPISDQQASQLGTYKDSYFFGRLFPNEEHSQQTGEDLTTFIKIVQVEGMAHNSLTETLPDKAETLFVSMKKEFIKAIIEECEKRFVANFPNKVLIAFKGKTVRDLVCAEFEKPLQHVSIPEVRYALPEIYRDCDFAFKSDATDNPALQGKTFICYKAIGKIRKFNSIFHNSDDYIFVFLTHIKEGGRGVDFKNVRTLIKFGFFSYEENVQIDGRINRIRSITSNDDTHRRIKVIFLLPNNDMGFLKEPRKELADYNQYNCYAIATRYLQQYMQYYYKVMKRLQSKSVSGDFIDHRMTLSTVNNDPVKHV